MGHRIESYSLNELNRISGPGAVAPCLFWVLPVGSWHPNDLDHLWRWFTEERSACKDYGLLLVKEPTGRLSEHSKVNLSSVAARLTDVMPEGTELFVRSSAFREGTQRLLVLSGGYPQPGWGVLVEWCKDVRLFEDIIRCASDRLPGDEQGTRGVGIFVNATENYHRWRNTRGSPDRPDLDTLNREILDGEKADILLRDAQNALERGEHSLAGEKTFEAVRALQQALWLNIPEQTLKTLLDLQQTLQTATSILALPEDVLAAEVESKLEALLGDPTTRQAAFRSLSSQELKRALTACLNLREKGSIGVGESIYSWAQRALTEHPARLGQQLVEIVPDVVARLKEHRGTKAQREREYELEVEGWRQRSQLARDAFHRSVTTAAELQWTLGPQFLVAFEDVCREHKIWVRSIPWDPARMVGWKLLVRRVSLDARDLQVVAREFSPAELSNDLGTGKETGLADGSYFTDYVHHIAISKPGITPRNVTRNLMARLVRPAEIASLIQLQGGNPPEIADAASLADELLDSFGWRRTDEVRERPLAGCIKTVDGGQTLLAEALSGNELRIVLESFCKDVLDVIVSQLGYSHKELWDAIDENIPDYRPLSRERDWDEEVRCLTAGTAIILLPVLGAFAFPTKRKEVEEIGKALRELSEILNEASHHKEEKRPSTDFGTAPALISEILKRTKELLGELPWHLHISSVYGDQPKIVSGEAWSHDSATPRLLRVIIWAGTAPGTKALLWNKTGRNPIVTDPVFIRRPRGS